MHTESQRQEQYRRTVYAPAQDARKAYWQSMWERSMHNPKNTAPAEPVEMPGDLPYPENPKNTWTGDPWKDVRGTPNAPCCRVTDDDRDLEAHMAYELGKILSLFRERQAKYGPKNIAEFGEVGVLVRLYDKLARLRNFYFDGGVGDMADESVEDAWSDISCYAAIALVCKRGRWPGATPSRTSKDAL